MPATSKKQFRAMKAAQAGKSTLGIPQDVGSEFAGATPSPGKLPESAPPPPKKAAPPAKKQKGKSFSFTK